MRRVIGRKNAGNHRDVIRAGGKHRCAIIGRNAADGDYRFLQGFGFLQQA